jgi:hypothetical protein
MNESFVLRLTADAPAVLPQHAEKWALLICQMQNLDGCCRFITLLLRMLRYIADSLAKPNP